MAASGKPATPGAPGSPFSTASPPARSARSPLRHPIPTSFMSAAAKACGAPTSRQATEFTNPPTAETPGNISACATASRSPTLLLTRKIPIAFSSPCWAIPTAPTPNAASSVPRTAAKTGRKFCTKMTTPAPPTSPSIPRIRKFSTRTCGLRAVRPGPPAARSKATRAAFSNPPTAANPGIPSQKVCRRTRKASAASASAFRPAVRIVCTRSWTPRPKSAACIAPTTPVKAGNA